MSEELGVRSEELAELLRYCAKGEPCTGCKLLKETACRAYLTGAALAEIERLTKELKGANHE